MEEHLFLLLGYINHSMASIPIAKGAEASRKKSYGDGSLGMHG